MRTFKTKETKEKDWTRPGEKLTHEEFMDGIKKAEERPVLYSRRNARATPTMEESKEKPVVYSGLYALDTDGIFEYGLETFGETQATRYEASIDWLTDKLRLYTFS